LLGVNVSRTDVLHGRVVLFEAEELSYKGSGMAPEAGKRRRYDCRLTARQLLKKLTGESKMSWECLADRLGWWRVRCVADGVSLSNARLPQITKQHGIFKAPCRSGNSRMGLKLWWNGTDGGKQKYWESGTLSATNLTWTDLGSNPYLRGKRMAPDILSHGGWNDLLEM
jgi:hypothetical protein